jgi:hypothetical protein
MNPIDLDKLNPTTYLPTWPSWVLPPTAPTDEDMIDWDFDGLHDQFRESSFFDNTEQ